MKRTRTVLGCTAALTLLACDDSGSPGSEHWLEASSHDAGVAQLPPAAKGSSPAPAPGSEFYNDQQEVTVAAHDAATSKPSDDGVACEIRRNYRVPQAGDVTLFDEPWLAIETFNGAGSIASAPDGSAYLIGTFGHELDLGAGEVRADAPISGFLHKLDGDCKPVRTQLLRATLDGQLAVPAAIDVDPQGNVYVALLGGPLVDLRPYHPYPIRWSTEFVVEKFSPRGESLYRTSIPAHGGWLSDMEVDAKGQVYLSGTATSFTDLGSGLPVDLSPFATHTFALALDAQGRYKSQWIDTGATMIEVAGDRIYSLANTTRSNGTLNQLFGMPEPWSGVALYARDDELAPLWDVAYPEDAYISTAEGLAGGGAALVLAEITQANEIAQHSLRVRRYASDGAQVSDRSFADQQRAVQPGGPLLRAPDDLSATFFQFVRETPDRGLALGALFYTDVVLAGTKVSGPESTGTLQIGDYTLPTATPVAAVLKLDSDDRIVWARPQDWGQRTVMLGLAPTPGGDVFVAGIATRDGTPQEAEVLEQALVVRKLRAN